MNEPNNSYPSDRALSADSLAAFVTSTLAVSTSTKFDVYTNLRLLDSAWEVQKQLWKRQEVVMP